MLPPTPSTLVVAAITLISLVASCDALAFGNSRAPQPQPPIRRVAVIGSGIAGLSLAHCLVDDDEMYQISLFDSRISADTTAGSGLQLNGGLAVMPAAVREAVSEASVQITDIQGRANAWFEGFGAKEMRKLYDLNTKKILEGAKDEKTIQMLTDPNGGAAWYSILRGTLQNILIGNLPKSARPQFGKKLTGIQKWDDSNAAKCCFADGTTAGPFDIIVGCDGIQSDIKRFVDTGKMNENELKSSSSAIYSGIRIQYAVKDGNKSAGKQDTSVLQQRFVDGAYFFRGLYGTGRDSPASEVAFCVKLDDDYIGPFRKGGADKDLQPKVSENVGWDQSDSRKQLLRQITEYNILEGSEVDIRPIVNDADRFFELGVYFHNPLSSWRSGWSRQIPGTSTYAVLCGDAAHAMPPFLGQGANQAMQDARCLANAIGKFNRQDGSLSDLLRNYESSRWWPTTSLTVKAAALGYLETGGPNGIFSKFRDLFFQCLNLAGVPQKVLLDGATPKI